LVSGDVVYVEALGQKMLILDSLEAVNDLMERRSAQYSDRPGSNIIKLYATSSLDTIAPVLTDFQHGFRVAPLHDAVW
jgi:hypothetical protein